MRKYKNQKLRQTKKPKHTARLLVSFQTFLLSPPSALFHQHEVDAALALELRIRLGLLDAFLAAG